MKCYSLSIYLEIIAKGEEIIQALIYSLIQRKSEYTVWLVITKREATNFFSVNFQVFTKKNKHNFSKIYFKFITTFKKKQIAKSLASDNHFRDSKS